MRKFHKNISDGALNARKQCREGLDLLRSRVYLLTGKDKLLMTMYLENGNSFRQMALLAGVNESNISRKIQALTKRLVEGEYIDCLRNRRKLSRLELRIAKDYFLKGLTQNTIAEKYDLSIYRTRGVLQNIRRVIKSNGG